MLTSHPTFPLSLPTCISTLFLFPHPFFFVCCLHFCVGLSDETPLPCHFRREKKLQFSREKGKRRSDNEENLSAYTFCVWRLASFSNHSRNWFLMTTTTTKKNNSIRYSLRLYPIQTPTPPKRRWSNQIERENNVVGSRHGQLLRLHSCFLYNSPRLSIICSPQWAIGLRDVDPSVFFWPGCLHGYEAHKHSGKNKTTASKTNKIR